jgi:hypothetical protein
MDTSRLQRWIEAAYQTLVKIEPHMIMPAQDLGVFDVELIELDSVTAADRCHWRRGTINAGSAFPVFGC